MILIFRVFTNRRRNLKKNRPKKVFFLENYEPKNRVFRLALPASPLNLVYIGIEGSFRKKLGSLSQKWNLKIVQRGTFGSAGGRIPEKGWGWGRDCYDKLGIPNFDWSRNSLRHDESYQLEEGEWFCLTWPEEEEIAAPGKEQQVPKKCTGKELRGSDFVPWLWLVPGVWTLRTRC